MPQAGKLTASCFTQLKSAGVKLEQRGLDGCRDSYGNTKKQNSVTAESFWEFPLRRRVTLAA
jgi:hypothetical protein